MMNKQHSHESAPKAVPSPRRAPPRHDTSASFGVQSPGEPTGTPPLPAQLLSLQRLAGNAAVERFVSSTRVPVGTVQRQPKPAAAPPPLPPTVAAPQDTEAIRKTALERLPIWIDTFANLWYAANNGALAVLPEPEDADFVSAVGMQAKLAFGVALAGNLVWASTCLVPPAAAGLIAAMSFGGATVGSGTVGVVLGDAPVSSQPSFRKAAGSALAKGRDSIVKSMKGDILKTVADECARDAVVDAEEQQKKLWSKTFTTAYDQAEPMHTAAATKLAAASASFVAEWRKHKSSPEVEKEAWRRTDDRIKRDGRPWGVWVRQLWEPSGPGGPFAEYRFGIYTEEHLKYAVESFKPALAFG